jgi:hypothetical protein
MSGQKPPQDEGGFDTGAELRRTPSAPPPQVELPQSLPVARRLWALVVAALVVAGVVLIVIRLVS